MKLTHLFTAAVCFTLSASLGCAQSTTGVHIANTPELTREDKVEKTDAQWKAQLTDLEYHVTREKGTERAWTGELLKEKQSGTFTCKCCDLPLFDASSKFDSGTGWPSFYKPIDDKAILDVVDNSFGVRTENVCSRCGAHLGHVFADGPAPTGLRYCMNSVSLKFVPKKAEGSAAKEDAAPMAKEEAAPMTEEESGSANKEDVEASME